MPTRPTHPQLAVQAFLDRYDDFHPAAEGNVGLAEANLALSEDERWEALGSLLRWAPPLQAAYHGHVIRTLIKTLPRARLLDTLKGDGFLTQADQSVRMALLMALPLTAPEGEELFIELLEGSMPQGQEAHELRFLDLLQERAPRTSLPGMLLGVWARGERLRPLAEQALARWLLREENAAETLATYIAQEGVQRGYGAASLTQLMCSFESYLPHLAPHLVHAWPAAHEGLLFGIWLTEALWRPRAPVGEAPWGPERRARLDQVASITHAWPAMLATVTNILDQDTEDAQQMKGIDDTVAYRLEQLRRIESVLRREFAAPAWQAAWRETPLFHPLLTQDRKAELQARPAMLARRPRPRS